MNWDNYTCEGQMTIFDFLPEMDLDDVPEENMVEQIATALGVKFEYEDEFWGWCYRQKKLCLRVNYSHYSFGDFRKFISVDASCPTGGSSGPMDSIEEAISFAKTAAENIGMVLGGKNERRDRGTVQDV